jgi:coproporphyrinogen III oxidase-like Fe-S oxidoreductase
MPPRSTTTAAGIPAYEISNHARVGEESRHNLSYWRYGDYLGIGPGAHGRVMGRATRRHRKPENWMASVDAARHGIDEETPLDPATRATEALMMGLRLAEGVTLGDIAECRDDHRPQGGWATEGTGPHQPIGRSAECNAAGHAAA